MVKRKKNISVVFSKTKKYSLSFDWKYEFIMMFFLASGITYVAYKVFFLFAPVIWSWYPPISAHDFAEPILCRIFVELGQQDGLEPYILVGLVLAVLLLTDVAIKWLKYRENGVRLMVWVLTAILSTILLGSVKFIPPYSGQELYYNTPLISQTTITSVSKIILSIAISALCITAFFLEKMHTKIIIFIISLFLIPICFIPVQSISIFDYTTILIPAQRLLHGFSLSQIFFLYDILHSAIAYFWMVLNWDLNTIQIVPRLAYYIFLVGLLAFSLSLLKTRRLSFLLVVSMVLFKIYATTGDIAFVFQGSPLRFDWWLIVCILIYWKGIYHWSIGLALCFLLIIHRLFGIFYSAGYIMIVVYIVFYNIQENGFNSEYLRSSIKALIPNILILLCSIFVNIFIYGDVRVDNIAVMRGANMGMTKISSTSFYWYVPIILAFTFALISRNSKNKVISSSYAHTGLFVLIAAVFNSIYFFGRSEEVNIMSIIEPVIFSLFIAFDIIERQYDFVHNTKQLSFILYVKKSVVYVLPIIFISLGAFYYRNHICVKSQVQLSNMISGRYIYPMELSSPTLGMPQRYPAFPMSLSVEQFKSIVRTITNNSEKVCFFSFYNSDFWYYYYSGYKSPTSSILQFYFLKKDLIPALQKLLDQKCDIVFDQVVKLPNGQYDVGVYAEIIPMLRYDQMTEQNGFMSISKK
jgi:hypothetical protein